MNGYTGKMRPNIREVKLMEITAYEPVLKQIIADMGGWRINPHYQVAINSWYWKAAMKAMTLKPIPKDLPEGRLFWHEYVNLIPLGIKHDILNKDGTEHI